ncbi:MAG: zinc ribbon domain-containing protein [Oscillospiraceae bacterium]|jgi:hypothetical protein|nr:zinc ribbon domain-containing protein [Oscillospiraceae bacterium]
MAIICTSCGGSIPDGVKFCTVCGAPAPIAAPQPAYQPVPQPAAQPALQPVYQPARQSEAPPAKGSIYAPIGALGYIGYFILFAIPVLGLVLALVWGLGKGGGNVNRRGLARAMFVFQLLAILVLIVGLIFGVAMQKTITNAVSEATGQQVSGIGDLFALFGKETLEQPNVTGEAEGGQNDETPVWEPEPDATDSTSASTNTSERTNAPDPGAYSSDTIFTAQWPKNDFTKQVPKPDFDVSFGSVNDTEYTALFGNVSTDALKKYVEKVKKAGFSKNAKTEDQNLFGLAVYSYTADNGKGYQVSIGTAMGMNAITIKKIG